MIFGSKGLEKRFSAFGRQGRQKHKICFKKGWLVRLEGGQDGTWRIVGMSWGLLGAFGAVGSGEAVKGVLGSQGQSTKAVW